MYLLGFSFSVAITFGLLYVAVEVAELMSALLDQRGIQEKMFWFGRVNGQKFKCMYEA